MLKIACIGCSWTEGVNIHHTHTYPYILHEKLLEQNVKNQVINAGRCAASLDYYPYVIQFLEKEFDPDYYIIQLTTHDRMLLGLEAHDKKLDFGYDTTHYDGYIKIWDNNKHWVHLSPGLGAGSSKHSNEAVKLQFADAFDEIYKKHFVKENISPNKSEDEVKNFFGLWWEHHMNSLVAKDKYYQNVDTIHKMIKHKKSKTFYWINYRPQAEGYNFPVVQDMFKDFDQLTIDKGMHFGKPGNLRLVDWLTPNIFGKVT
jgi:hypothetical protein